MLVFTFQTLLKDKVTACDISIAKVALNKYVEKAESLYGIENLSFNMRLLLHMPRYVKDWGAPWASSAFTYEHGNGLIVRLYNSTQNVIDQIFRSYELSCYIEQTASSIFNERSFESSAQLFGKLVYNDRDIKKCTHENQNLIVLGIAESYTPSPETVVRIENCLDPNLYITEDLDGLEIKVYHRFIWKNVLYSTTLYRVSPI